MFWGPPTASTILSTSSELGAAALAGGHRRVARAGRRALSRSDEGERAQLVRESGDDGNGGDAAGQRVPGEGHRLAAVARDRCVGDVEAAGLDAPRIVRAHGRLVYRPLDVGQELGRRRNELSDVVAVCVDKRLDGVGCHAPAGPSHFVSNEGGLLVRILDGRNLAALEAAGAHSVEEAFAPRPAVVAQDEHDVGVRGGDVGEGVGEEGVAHLLEVARGDDVRLGKERGADGCGKLACGVLFGVDLRHGGGRIAFEGPLDEPRNGPVAEDGLADEKQDDRSELDLVVSERACLSHGTSISRGPSRVFPPSSLIQQCPFRSRAFRVYFDSRVFILTSRFSQASCSFNLAAPRSARTPRIRPRRSSRTISCRTHRPRNRARTRGGRDARSCSPPPI